MIFIDVLDVRSGLGQSDSINRLIQLTVIELSGGHCNKKPIIMGKHPAVNFINVVHANFLYEHYFGSFF
jgi:hypothetical protein